MAGKKAHDISREPCSWTSERTGLSLDNQPQHRLGSPPLYRTVGSTLVTREYVIEKAARPFSGNFGPNPNRR